MIYHSEEEGDLDMFVYIFHHPSHIAPDKAAYCVFTQFLGAENAIKLISVRTKTQ